MIQANSYARSCSYDISEQTVSTAAVRRTYTRVNSKRVIVIKSAICLFAYALVLVYLCIKSATLGYQIVEVQKQIDNLETANKRIEYQIARQTSLQRVEKIAVTDLGMYKPDDSAVLQIAAQPQQVMKDRTPQNSLSQQPTTGANTLQKVYKTIAVMSR